MSQLKKKFLLDNAVDQSKILLNNNVHVRARNAADSADVNVVKLNASDRIEFASVPQVGADPLTANDLARKYYVDQQVAALGTQAEWQSSVLSSLDTPPVSPTTGDRHLIIATATGVWAGKENQIAQYNGTGWDYTIPTTGTYLSDDSQPSYLLYFGGASWTIKYFESTTASTGLVKVGFDIRLDASSAGSGLGFSAGVLSVNVDGSTIEINADTLRIKDAGVTPTKIDRTDTGLTAATINMKSGYAAAAGTVAATDTIQEAIQKVDGNIAAHISNASGAHAATAISYNNAVSGLTATNVKAAIDEVEGRLDTAESTLSTHVAASAAHGVTGNIVGTSDSQALTNKTINASLNTISNITVSNLGAGVLDTDLSSVSASDDTIPSAKATKAEIIAQIAAVPTPREEVITLNGTDISNKYKDLLVAASNAGSIMVHPADGIPQVKTLDYSVSLSGGAAGVTRISWSGLGLESLLASGDIIVVRYESAN